MDLITLALCQKMINEIDKGAKIQVVQVLPQTGESNTIYLVPKQGIGTNDVFDEFIYVDNTWEQIGTTNIDLTDYVRKTDYATTQTAGVFKSNSNFGTQINNSGYLTGVSKSYEDWENLHPDCFITRYTLDNYANGRGLLDSSNVASVAISGEYSDLSSIPIEYAYLYGNINISSLSRDYNSCNLILSNNIDSSIIISIDGTHDFSINPGTAIMVLRSRYDTALYDDIYYIFLENKILKIKCYNNNGQFDILNVEEIKSYDVLEKNNTTAYTPSGDYNPATKKYVDDAISNAVTTVLGGSY